MNLDLKLTQLALKMKNFILLDFSFPAGKFPEFKKNYENRYISVPGRKVFALDYASGIALSGKFILLYGIEEDLKILDPSLNIKLIKYDENANWAGMEEKISEFGSGLLLIPKEL